MERAANIIKRLITEQDNEVNTVLIKAPGYGIIDKIIDRLVDMKVTHKRSKPNVVVAFGINREELEKAIAGYEDKGVTTVPPVDQVKP